MKAKLAKLETALRDARAFVASNYGAQGDCCVLELAEALHKTTDANKETLRRQFMHTAAVVRLWFAQATVIPLGKASDIDRLIASLSLCMVELRDAGKAEAKRKAPKRTKKAARKPKSRTTYVARVGFGRERDPDEWRPVFLCARGRDPGVSARYGLDFAKRYDTRGEAETELNAWIDATPPNDGPLIRRDTAVLVPSR